MYDDPRKMQKAEMTDEEFEAFYGELFKEFGPQEEDLLEGSPVKKNADAKSAARKYQGSNAPAYGGSLDEEPVKPVGKQKQAPKKEKGVKGLVICACLECLAIVAVVLWWVVKIL